MCQVGIDGGLMVDRCRFMGYNKWNFDRYGYARSVPTGRAIRMALAGRRLGVR